MWNCRWHVAGEARPAEADADARSLPFRLGRARAAIRLLPFALCLFLSVLPFSLRGADAETRTFNAAAKAFQDGFAERAEREFAEFVQKFPTSLRLPDAILLQARAAFSRKDITNAVDLLTSNLFRAGTVADQFRFWLGQMRLESGDHAAAAADFAQLISDYPTSARRLEASYGEAQARFKLQEWVRVVELLRKPDGAFQQAARGQDRSDLVARGQLLLGEALVKQQDYSSAETVAQSIPTNATAIAWSRQFLLCRIQLSTDRAPAALRSTTNLLALAAASDQPPLQAESLALQGAILEALQEYEAAVGVYEKIQADTMPEGQRRDAFLHVVELMLTQNRLADATARLQKFLAAHPADAASDEVLLTLGELRLKEHLLGLAGTNAPAPNELAGPLTNRLQQAILHFDELVQKYPQSPHLGKAHLNRGWALLTDGKTLEAQAAFKLAAEKLPFSEDQAVARFKLADTQFLQNDLTNALAGYRKLIDDYGGLPRVRTGLFDRAWYQIARVSMRLGDLVAASDAMSKILNLYPASLYAERLQLLIGQELSQTNQSARARELFTEFTRTFTNSSLLPEVRMALARSHEMEHDWPAAIRAYDELLALFPTNAAAPRAEFLRALASDQAGRETNALSLFTNFLARFPGDALAPRAQDWIGDFYFRNEDFAEAERNYQRLYQNTNWPATELMFEAKFKAGRAAIMRQGYDDAIGYFLSLINDKQCPAPLVAETFFAYGDALIGKPAAADSTNALARFVTALETFRKIPQLYPASPLVPRALGRMADCHVQLASQDARHYTNALEFYEKAMNAPLADVATRSQAEVGLALVLVKQAQMQAAPDPERLNSALDHYLNVFFGKNLHDNETPGPLWVKEAGFAAAKILETQKRWGEAINVYQRLQPLLPSLRPLLDKKIKSARDQDGTRPE